jgi:hypothetical protein
MRTFLLNNPSQEIILTFETRTEMVQELVVRYMNVTYYHDFKRNVRLKTQECGFVGCDSNRVLDKGLDCENRISIDVF